MLGSQKSKGSKSTPTIDGDRDNVPYAKLTVRAWDPDTNLLLASDKGEHYLGACFIADPLKGADDATVDKFRSALSMPFPAGTFIQIGLLSSPTQTNSSTRTWQGRTLRTKCSARSPSSMPRTSGMAAMSLWLPAVAYW